MHIYLTAKCQIITGQVINESTGDPLVYVNIGILGSNMGTISDENGYFKLFVKDQPNDAKIKFTMIGFKSQTLSVIDFKEDKNLIKLKEDITYLKEITITSSKPILKKIGTKNSSRNIVTGWGTYGTGGERGLRIDVKNQPIRIKDLNFYIAENSFDSVLLRLHIRSIANKIPSIELLKENILITVSKKSGWIKVDLSNNNLIYEQDVVVTLEWVRAWGKCKGSECLLFSLSLTKGTLYAKEASEGSWSVKKLKSPGIYLTVQN